MWNSAALPHGSVSEGPPYRILCVFGTRPEAIKMAPVIAALKGHPEAFTTRVAVTGQHRQLLDQVLEAFRITPDYDLNLMTPEQTLTDITVRVLTGLDPVLARERPHLVLVHGDTTTTFAAALAAFYRKIPVGHVEAGLRTGNPHLPFPEEMNRRLTGALCRYHFAPTPLARRNLLAENVPAENIFVTGNTVVDALLATVRADYQFQDSVLAALDFSSHRVVVVTTHRRENLGAPLREVYRALKDILRAFPDTAVVFPLHNNPRVRRVARQELAGVDRVLLIEPPPYAEFVNLMARAHLILTDSGGIQEEAPVLGKPVLVLRDQTERPEPLTAGSLKLVGANRDRLVEEMSRLLTDERAYRSMARPSSPVGDGQAAARIAGYLLYVFRLSPHPPAPFGEVVTEPPRST